MRNRSRVHIAALTAASVLLAACTSSARTHHPGARMSTAGTGHPTGAPASPGPRAGGAAPTPHPGARATTGHDGVFTVSFAGDVHFAGRIATRLATDPHTVFGAAAAQLRRADLTMVNLETAITTRGRQQSKEFTFRAPPKALKALRYAGVDVATMANNHGADYGEQGLHDSLAASRSQHFPIIGIGRDENAAFAPYRTRLHGVKVAIFAADQVQDETTLPLFSASPTQAGVANAYYPRLISDVHRASRAGWTVIVYVHWGIELQTCPSADQEGLAGRLAAAGASAVIGTHAHVLQGAGYERNGTYVAYGLGNYLWWLSFGNEQDDNGVLTLTFHGRRVTGAHFAASQLDQRGVPMPAGGSTLQRIDQECRTDRACTDLSARRPH